MTAYLCGAGVHDFVYDLRGYSPNDTAERAAEIAIELKRFNVGSRYVGLDLDQVAGANAIIDVWKSHLEERVSPTIDAAIESFYPGATG